MTPFEQMMASQNMQNAPAMAQPTPFDQLLEAAQNLPTKSTTQQKSIRDQMQYQHMTGETAGDIFRFADNVVRMLASGASFGLIDKGAALANAAFGKGSYEKNAAEELARSKTFEEENPYIAIPAQIAGGIGTAIALGPFSQGIRAPNIAKTIIGGGGAGGAAAFGQSENPSAEDIRKGGMSGAALGAAIPIAGQAVMKGGSKLMNAIAGTSPERATLAQRAAEMGIPLSAAQVGESTFPKYLESVLDKLPMVYRGTARTEQHPAFTSAVARTFGESADKITPEVMDRAKTRLGKEFNRLAEGITIQADDAFRSRLAAIQDEAAQVLGDSEVKPILNQIGNISSKITDGILDGKVYQALTRKGAPLDRALSSADPNIKYYAGQVREALDEAMQKSISPDAAAQLRNARLQYKNMKTVEDLVEKSTDGLLSPALLMNEVRKSYKNMAYQGAGEIGDLAKIGQTFLKSPPTSGTSERLGIMAALAGGGASLANPSVALPTLGGLGAAIAGGNIARGALNSDFYRNLMIANALRKGPLITPEMQALAAQSMALSGGGQIGRPSNGQ